ncbi:hypothetical protein [Cognaticolwellia mytili]|uniref:hypothetical protein n=1 Tax=Cognaticolwellia mytili TaxID=1888913 RepID=UPI000A1755A0|nr:hypothetical protein [Cognaticolwellia mytili]
MQDHEVQFAHRNYSSGLKVYNKIIEKLSAYKQPNYDQFDMSISTATDISSTAHFITMLGTQILIDFTISPYSDRTDFYYGKINCYLGNTKDSLLHSFYFDHYENIFSNHPDEDNYEDITFSIERKIIIILSKAVIEQL